MVWWQQRSPVRDNQAVARAHTRCAVSVFCGEPVKRLLFPVAIQFKGDGFYTTDYARRSSLKPADSEKPAKAASDSSSDGSSSAKDDGSSGNGKSKASEVGASAPTAKSD